MIKILFNKHGKMSNPFCILDEAKTIVNENKIGEEKLIHTCSEDLLFILLAHVKKGTLPHTELKICATVCDTELIIRHDETGELLDQLPYMPSTEVLDFLFD